MKTSICRAGLLAALVVSASCGGADLPTAPTPPTVPTAPVDPVPTPTPVRTPFAGPGVYEFVRLPPGGNPAPWVLGALAGSRYTLKADGTFVLQFSNPLASYAGRYTEADGLVTFDYDWNAQKAGATAVFEGDAMSVTYDAYMSWSDFPDGVYVRLP